MQIFCYESFTLQRLHKSGITLLKWIQFCCGPLHTRAGIYGSNQWKHLSACWVTLGFRVSNAGCCVQGESNRCLKCRVFVTWVLCFRASWLRASNILAVVRTSSQLSSCDSQQLQTEWLILLLKKYLIKVVQTECVTWRHSFSLCLCRHAVTFRILGAFLAI